jgi:hypothetical protein
MHGNHAENKSIAVMDKKEAIDKVKAYQVLVKEYFPVEKVYLCRSHAKDSFLCFQQCQIKKT